MRVVEADTIKVSRIQRRFRIKSAIRKVKCMRFTVLQKRMDALMMSQNASGDNKKENSSRNERSHFSTEYRKLVKMISTVREDAIRILFHNVSMVEGGDLFIKNLSCAMAEGEYANACNILCATSFACNGISGLKRNEHFRTGCELEEMVVSGSRELKALLEAFCEAVISGPEKAHLWREEHQFIQSKMERYSRGFYEYRAWKTENEVCLNLCCIKQIHEYSQLESSMNDACEGNLSSMNSEFQSTTFEEFIVKCQWMRKYIHERICNVRPKLRPPTSTPGKIILGNYHQFAKFYTPYLEADGTLKLPEGPEPENLKRPVLSHNLKPICVHPPSHGIIFIMLHKYTKMQQAMHEENKIMVEDEDTLHEKILNDIVTSQGASRFHYISICADLDKIHHQLRNPYPGSIVLVYFLDYLRMECVFIQQVVSKLEGCENANFDIPVFQRAYSFVLYRSNYIVGGICRDNDDEENEKHYNSLDLIIDYLTKIDEFLHQVTLYVSTKGLVKKFHNINMKELLTKDIVTHLPLVNYPTFSELKDHFNEQDTRTAFTLATEIIHFLIYAFIKKEEVKQNITVAYILHDLKQKDSSSRVP
jgi:hypothetical protein